MRAHPDDEGRIIAALTEHLEFAEAQFAIFRDLQRAAVREEPGVTLAHDLFWFSLHAHRETAILHLARLFDSHKNVSLTRLISVSTQRVSAATVAEDRARVSNAPDVKRLLRLRNAAFAHRSLDSARKGTAASVEEAALSDSDIQKLLADAFTILRRYGKKHLSRQLLKRADAARAQLASLLVYLQDAESDGFGFVRLQPEIDGAIRRRNNATSA